MQLLPHDIHVWTTSLLLSPEKEAERVVLLNPEEMRRANRFHFSLHKSRFIAARSTLRLLLGQYLDLPPAGIAFAETLHHKPYLAGKPSIPLQFNVSHSADYAAFAFTLTHDIGIDIEAIRNEDNPSVAHRFFSDQENLALNALSPEKRISAFYKLWAHKEALLKATGKGLALPLSSFSVSLDSVSQTVLLEGMEWSLVSLFLHPLFQAALASNQLIHSISCRNFSDEA